MKTHNILFASIIAFLLITVNGCNIIGDIFQAGIWTGVILIVIVVVIIIAIVSRIRKRF